MLLLQSRQYDPLTEATGFESTWPGNLSDKWACCKCLPFPLWGRQEQVHTARTHAVNAWVWQMTAADASDVWWLTGGGKHHQWELTSHCARVTLYSFTASCCWAETPTPHSNKETSPALFEFPPANEATSKLHLLYALHPVQNIPLCFYWFIRSFTC